MNTTTIQLLDEDYWTLAVGKYLKEVDPAMYARVAKALQAELDEDQE